MIKANKYAREHINQWLNTIQNGDTIRIENGYAILRNSAGCELDMVRLS